MRLALPTSDAWLEAVLADFDAFLLDHAACEAKAAASAEKLAKLHADKAQLVQEMWALVDEEREHFALVRGLLEARGLGAAQTPFYKDAYVARLARAARKSPEHVLMDRLLVSAIIEARACERLHLVATALPAGELRDHYTELTRSEARHHGLFVRLAKLYAPAEEVDARLGELLALEAEIVASLPIRPAIH